MILSQCEDGTDTLNLILDQTRKDKPFDMIMIDEDTPMLNGSKIETLIRMFY